MSMMTSGLAHASSALLALMLAGTVWAQQPAQPGATAPEGYREAIQFQGKTTVQTKAGPKALTIVIKKLTFEPRRTSIRIPLPERGVAILQHRAGELEIVVGKTRRRPLEGERVTINLPQVVMFTTANDTAMVDVIIVAE
jgi:hypothetical protein